MRFAVIVGYILIGLAGMAFCRPSPQAAFTDQSTLPATHQPAVRLMPQVSARTEDVTEIHHLNSGVPIFIPRQSVSPVTPRGNAETRAFLAWAKKRWDYFCVVELDDQGRCIEVQTHICWNVTDEELKVIAELKDVRSLFCNGGALTDSGLRHIVNMPALQHLKLIGTGRITETALQELRDARPDIELELPGRPRVDQ